MVGEIGVPQTARLVHIPQATIHNWQRTQNQLPKGKRRPGGGRKPILSQSDEEELAKWVQTLRNDGLAVTQTLVRIKAKSTYSGEVPWKCSQGWMDNFCQRWKLSLRIPTEQKGSANTMEERNEKIQRFWRHVIAVRIFVQMVKSFLRRSSSKGKFQTTQTAWNQNLRTTQSMDDVPKR